MAILDIAELDAFRCTDQTVAAVIAVEFMDQPLADRAGHQAAPDLSCEHWSEQGAIKPVTQDKPIGASRFLAAALARQWTAPAAIGPHCRDDQGDYQRERDQRNDRCGHAQAGSKSGPRLAFESAVPSAFAKPSRSSGDSAEATTVRWPRETRASSSRP